MADMHTPLLPCPHCGGEAKDGYHEAYSVDSSFDWIGCDMCEVQIPYHREEDRSSAVAAWNRRAPSQDAETVKALRELSEDALPILEIVLEEREDAQGEEDETFRDLIARFRAALAGSAS